MDKLPETIGKIIDELAKRFGSTGQHLWEVLVRQQIVSSHVWLGVGIFFGVAGLVSWLLAAFIVNDDSDVGCALFCIGAFCAFVAICGISGGYMGLANPEYYALTDLIAMVK